METNRALQIAPEDNVATALAALAAGMEVTVIGAGTARIVRTRDAIPFGHKLALVAIPRGEWVRKYGQPIGAATEDIPLGAHAHVHNVKGQRGRKSRQREPGRNDGASDVEWSDRT